VSDNVAGAKLRATAARIVDSVVTEGRSLDRALATHEQEVSARDRALLRNLCYGTLRYHWHLQAWLNALLSRPLKVRDSCINQLLAVGLYQLSDTRIPDHAVVSETVEAARHLHRPKLSGLVNAILRRFLRERDSDLPALNEAAEYDHPQWLIDMLRSDWPDDWQAILTANNERAAMWLRVNPAHAGSRDYLAQLQAQDIGAELLDGLPQAVRLIEPHAVEQLPGFAAGHVSVQDAAAQLASPWLLQDVCGRVLDACAAPGGKSGHLLEIGGGDIELTCLDNDAGRVQGIAENLDRLGLPATILCGDASNPEEWWDGKPFAGILLDAPCSASGVIRRHPDIKHLRRRSDIVKLAAAQQGMLTALWPTLAPGGRLLYVTCSVLAAENERVVERFLATRPDAREVDVLQNNNIHDLMRSRVCGVQVLPGTAGMDGFYFACLEKVS
jgi:16S rRNA (cytosine967-C5)-methyltransferase